MTSKIIFGRCEAQFLSMSQENTSQKEYKGWWESKPVLIFMVIAAVMSVIGISLSDFWSKPHTDLIPQPIHHTDVSKPTATASMPVISGDYTLCSHDESHPYSPKWLNFLYDVYTNAGKSVFFDVRVDVECLVGKTDSWQSLGRQVGSGQVQYSFQNLGLFTTPEQLQTNRQVDFPRDINRLRDMLPDNGSFISIRQDFDGRNAYSRLHLEAEGMEDHIYGPFLIKIRGEDGFIQFELYPSHLDSAAEAVVAQIAARNRDQR
jgi:hypothetical protein